MKKLLIILFICCYTATFAQLDSSTKKYKQEFGTDVTAFIKQLLRYDNTSAQYGPELPPYYISYRYHLGKSNIRAGIAASYSSVKTPGYMVNMEGSTFHNTVMSGSVRLGYEWYSTLSKRWQSFYGLDVVYARSIINQEAQYTNAGYVGGYKNNDVSYKTGPVLGFRFCFNQRLSLTTETSLLFSVLNASSQRTYLSQDPSLYPAVPNSRPTNTTSFDVKFTQPLSLFLTVKL